MPVKFFFIYRDGAFSSQKKQIEIKKRNGLSACAKRKTGTKPASEQFLIFKIIIYALILSIIGIFMVHSATQNEAVTGMITTTQKQILGMVIGLVLMMILTCIDYHKLIKYSIVFYVISMALFNLCKIHQSVKYQ